MNHMRRGRRPSRDREKFEIQLNDPKLFKHLFVVKVKMLNPAIKATSYKRKVKANLCNGESRPKSTRFRNQIYPTLNEDLISKSPEPEKGKDELVKKRGRGRPRKVRDGDEATSSTTRQPIQQVFPLPNPGVFNGNSCWGPQNATPQLLRDKFTKATKAALKSYSIDRNEEYSSKMQAAPKPSQPLFRSDQPKIPSVQIEGYRRIESKQPTNKASTPAPFVEKMSSIYKSRYNYSTCPPKPIPPHIPKESNESDTRRKGQAATSTPISKNTPNSFQSSPISTEQGSYEFLTMHRLFPIQPLHPGIQLAKANNDENCKLQKRTPKLRKSPPKLQKRTPKLQKSSKKVANCKPIKSILPVSHEDINQIQKDEIKPTKYFLIDLTQSSDEDEPEPKYPVEYPVLGFHNGSRELDSNKTGISAETTATLTPVASPPDYSNEVDVVTSSPFFDHQADIIKRTFVDKSSMTCEMSEIVQPSTTITNARDEIVDDNMELENLSVDKAILKYITQKTKQNDSERESQNCAANTCNETKERPTLLNFTSVIVKNNSIANPKTSPITEKMIDYKNKMESAEPNGEDANKEIKENDLTQNAMNSESLKVLDDVNLLDTQDESSSAIEIRRDHNDDVENETIEKNDSASFSIDPNIENGHFGIFGYSDCSGNGSQPQHQLPPKKRTSSYSSEVTNTEEYSTRNNSTNSTPSSVAQISSEAQASSWTPQSFINVEPMQEDTVNISISNNSNPNPSQNLEPKEKPIPSDPDVSMKDVTPFVSTDSGIGSLGSANIPSKFSHTHFCENYQTPTLQQPSNNFSLSSTEHQLSPLIPVPNISARPPPPTRRYEIKRKGNGARPNKNFIQPQYEPISPPESPASHKLEIEERIIFHFMYSFCEAMEQDNYSGEYFYPMPLSQGDCNIVNDILAEIYTNLEPKIKRVLHKIFKGRTWMLQTLYKTSSFVTTREAPVSLLTGLHYEQKDLIICNLYDIIRDWLKEQFQEWEKKCHLTIY